MNHDLGDSCNNTTGVGDTNDSGDSGNSVDSADGNDSDDRDTYTNTMILTLKFILMKVLFCQL